MSNDQQPRRTFTLHWCEHLREWKVDPEPKRVVSLNVQARETRPDDPADLDEALRRLAVLERRVAEYEEVLSEVVTPDLVSESWVNVLPDGTGIPIMRGDPKLKDFITLLHHAINDPGLIDVKRATRQPAGENDD